MGRSLAWRVPRGASLHWREWDDEFVLYHEQSGDTHRLNATGAAVVRMLTADTLTAADLTARLVSPVDPAGAPTVDIVATLLEELAASGLIESAPIDADPAGA